MSSPVASSPQENETFKLANGHAIGFSACGPPSAPALFFFHGQCGSRLGGLALSEVADNVGLRVISPDRPGIGLSTFDPYRRLLDYPSQISQLAKHLGLETYRVMGGSGGGPYALGESLPHFSFTAATVFQDVKAGVRSQGHVPGAVTLACHICNTFVYGRILAKRRWATDLETNEACAYALPRNELKGAAVLAGIGPPGDAAFSQTRQGTRILFAAFRYTPGLLRWLAEALVGKMVRDPNPEVMRRQLASQMSYVKAMLSAKERETFDKSRFVDELVQDLREHFRQGPHGFVRDGQINVEPWGFELEDVPFPGVRLYYGSEDTNTPRRVGENMAAKLKGAVFKAYEGETHMTLFDKHAEDILRDIAEH